MLIDHSHFHSAALSLSATHLSQRTIANHLLAYAQKHYTSYILGRAPALLILKKYFYVLHPLLTLRCLRHNPRLLPPLDFRQLAQTTPELDAAARDQFIQLLDLKLTQRLAYASASHLLVSINLWIDKEIEGTAAFIATLPAHAALRVPNEPFDALLRRMLLGDGDTTKE